jgi:putative photosynthetic complex assembly protein
MNATHHDEIIIPRGLLYGAGVMIVASLLLVGAARFLDFPAREPDARAVQSRSLLFTDRSDGGIDVIDATSRERVTTVAGEGGFLRGALRALARERIRDGLGPQQPFVLIGRSDGRLTLLDPQTSKRIDLEAFGPTNASAFSALLNARSDQR